MQTKEANKKYKEQVEFFQKQLDKLNLEMSDQGKCILILQEKVEKLTAQNEILRHDLKTQEYFNVKVHEGNKFKDSYSRFT